MEVERVDDAGVGACPWTVNQPAMWQYPTGTAEQRTIANRAAELLMWRADQIVGIRR